MNAWITKFKTDEPAGSAVVCPCATQAHGSGRFWSPDYDPTQGGWVLDAGARALRMYGPDANINDPDAYSYSIPLTYDDVTGEFSSNGQSIGSVGTDPNSADFGQFTITEDFWVDITALGEAGSDVSHSKQALDIAAAPTGNVSGPWKIKHNSGGSGGTCTTYVENIDTSSPSIKAGTYGGNTYNFTTYPISGGSLASRGGVRYFSDGGGAPLGVNISLPPGEGFLKWYGPGFYYYLGGAPWPFHLITEFSVGATCDTTPTPAFSTSQPGSILPGPFCKDGTPHTPGNFKTVAEGTPTGGIVTEGYSDPTNRPGVYGFSVAVYEQGLKNQYTAFVSEDGVTTVSPGVLGINPAALATAALYEALTTKLECNHKNVNSCKAVGGEVAVAGDLVTDIVPEGCQVSIANPTIKGEASTTVAANNRNITVSFYPPNKDTGSPNIPDSENPDEGGTPPGSDDELDPGDTPPISIPGTGGGGGTNGGGTPNIDPPDPEKVIRFVPNTLDFGETGVGKYKEALFSIQNQGTEPVLVRTLIPAFAGVSGDFSIEINIPKTLNPGASVSGRVVYFPKEETITQEVFYAVTTNDEYLDALTILGYSTVEGPGEEEPVPTKILHLYEGYFVNNTVIFGDTLYGETRTGFLYARNEGDLPINFQGITLTGPYTLANAINPQVIQPNMYLEIPIVFTPTGNETYTGQAAVTSDADNADGEGKVYAGLVGKGFGYEEPPVTPIRILELEVESQDFGFSPIGTPKSITFRLKSTGTHSVTFYLLLLRDPNPVVDPPAFVLSFDNYPLLDGSIDNGVTLEPGATSELITLTFTPDRETTFSAQVFHQSLSNATEAPWGWDFTGLGYDPANDIPDEPIPPGPGPDPEPTPEGEPPSDNTYPDGVGPACVAKPCVVKFIYEEKL